MKRKQRATSFLGFGTAPIAPAPVVETTVQADPEAEKNNRLRRHAARIVEENARLKAEAEKRLQQAAAARSRVTGV
jgi:hypothetical protein